MKKMSYLGLIVFLIVIIITMGTFYPGTLFPRFTGFGCKDSSVVIYNGAYNPIKGEITLLVKNTGLNRLALEIFLDNGEKITKSSMIIYLSAGGQGAFSIASSYKPSEITLRDQQCPNAADLWKFT